VFGTTTSSPKLGCAKFDYKTQNINSDIANDRHHHDIGFCLASELNLYPHDIVKNCLQMKLLLLCWIHQDHFKLCTLCNDDVAIAKIT